MRRQPKRRRRPKKWLYPLSVEREYEKLLLKLCSDMQAEIERRLPLLRDIRQDGLDDMPAGGGWFERLRQWLMAVSGSLTASKEAAMSAVKLLLQQADRFNRRQFHAVVRSVYGVEVFTHEPWLLELLSEFEADNIRLIQSIPAQYLETLHGKMVATIRNGGSHRDLVALIRDSYRLPKSRARLIARDQTGKLNGQLTRYRQQQIGVEEYVWRGVLDSREREHHVEREGEKFRWSEPPEGGHPGMDFQCRCYAEAVFPDLEDLKGVVYEHPLRPSAG